MLSLLLGSLAVASSCSSLCAYLYPSLLWTMSVVIVLWGCFLSLSPNDFSPAICIKGIVFTENWSREDIIGLRIRYRPMYNTWMLHITCPSCTTSYTSYYHTPLNTQVDIYLETHCSSHRSIASRTKPCNWLSYSIGENRISEFTVISGLVDQPKDVGQIVSTWILSALRGSSMTNTDHFFSNHCYNLPLFLQSVHCGVHFWQPSLHSERKFVRQTRSRTYERRPLFAIDRAILCSKKLHLCHVIVSKPLAYF